MSKEESYIIKKHSECQLELIVNLLDIQQFERLYQSTSYKKYYRFIQKRDQTESEPHIEDIILTDGAS